MLPIIISSGQGLDSEDLSLFNDEEIGGLKLTERILLILANEGFDKAQIVSEIQDIGLKRLKKKFPNFQIIQSSKFPDFKNETDLLLFQNNIVLNKKQLQSTLEIIKDNNESMIIGDNNSGIIFICLLYTSPSPRDLSTSRMPSSA